VKFPIVQSFNEPTSDTGDWEENSAGYYDFRDAGHLAPFNPFLPFSKSSQFRENPYGQFNYPMYSKTLNINRDDPKQTTV
jgi:hypothetical protein